MKYIFLIFFSFLFLSGSAQHRNRVSFNEGWRFRLDSVHDYSGTTVNDRDWRQLDLPHDWSIEGAFSKDHPAGTGGGALPGGIGWYRKTFKVPMGNKGRKYVIEFDGVYKNAEVFVNGHSLGVRPNGYISFHYDISPFLIHGQTQVIAVKVDNSRQPNSRWYSGSGIYRNVWLTSLDFIHINHWGTYITTPEVNDKNSVVKIHTDVAGNLQGASVILRTIIIDPSGRQLKQSDQKITGKVISQTFNISNPKLWSTDKPHLYKAVSQVLSKGSVLDTYETGFGIRSFHFDAEQGFFLNGKPLKILGVCNHHDLGALGAAINTRALERQLQILKAMGCNGIRTSHNPPAPELLELTDKMGFIVMDEAFDMWARSKSPFDYALNWKQWHRRDLEDFIKRDRNHPSVIMWSAGNEISEQWGEDTSGRVISRELAAIIRSLDSTRPVTTGNNEVNKWNHLIQSGAFDLIGYNYNHKKWAQFQQDYPGQKLIVTESTSALQTRGYYDLVPFDTIRRWPVRWDLPFENGNPGNTVSAYDHVSAPWGSTHEESVVVFKKYPHISGMYIWTGFDYLGEPTPYGWPSRSSYFGIIDLAGFPKDVYYLYQSEFTNKPVLHLYPHWNWKTGDTVDVISYYNAADAVELFLNGRSLGKRSKNSEQLHVKWRVPFEKGVLKAVSYKEGKKILSKEVQTAGEPAAVVLQADRPVLKAGGQDLSFIKAVVVDRKGIMVPEAELQLKFTVTGAGFLRATDNGNPVSLESFQSPERKTMNGLALAIVQAGKKGGTVTVTAEGEGIKSSTIRIIVK